MSKLNFSAYVPYLVKNSIRSLKLRSLRSLSKACRQALASRILLLSIFKSTIGIYTFGLEVILKTACRTNLVECEHGLFFTSVRFFVFICVVCRPAKLCLGGKYLECTRSAISVSDCKPRITDRNRSLIIQLTPQAPLIALNYHFSWQKFRALY